jgi:hypothetical protein
VDPDAVGLKQIDHPVPPAGGLDDHLRIRACLRHRRRDGDRVIGDPDARELLARRAQPNDHRPATMKVDPDVLSIHRGLPSSWV